MSDINEKDVIDMYVKENVSTYAIAEKYNTYPNKINRILRKNGVQLNDRQIAQQLALAEGRAKHPTKGKIMSQEARLRISERMSRMWKEMSDEERQKIVDRSKSQWYNMSETEREALFKSAHEGMRKASVDGAKLERFIRDELIKLGYSVIFHKTGLIPNEKLEIDLFLPVLNVAIEIDGPSHFLPLFGEEKLHKHIVADSKKSGLLLNYGFMIIRVKYIEKDISNKKQRDILSKIVAVLEKVKKEFPPKGKRYVELEMN